MKILFIASALLISTSSFASQSVTCFKNGTVIGKAYCNVNLEDCRTWCTSTCNKMGGDKCVVLMTAQPISGDVTPTPGQEGPIDSEILQLLQEPTSAN